MKKITNLRNTEFYRCLQAHNNLTLGTVYFITPNNVPTYRLIYHDKFTLENFRSADYQNEIELENAMRKFEPDFRKWYLMRR